MQLTLKAEFSITFTVAELRLVNRALLGTLRQDEIEQAKELSTKMMTLRAAVFKELNDKNAKFLDIPEAFQKTQSTHAILKASASSCRSK